MLVIFDCHYVCYAAAFAMSQGLIYRGQRVEVIFGFLKQIIACSTRFDADNFAFCWDSPKSKRRLIYPEYKRNRAVKLQEDPNAAATKEIIEQQINILRDQVLPELGFSNNYIISGYEADDLIACIVKNRDPSETIIITSDNDLYQLLDNGSIFSPTKNQTTNREIFRREYGIEPSEWFMAKAIAGCNGDNVIGVKGVGIKTAIKYMKGYRKGSKSSLIDMSSDMISRNIPLVKLPFQGCPTPAIKSNTLSVKKFERVCEKFNFRTLMEQSLRSWDKMSNTNR